MLTLALLSLVSQLAFLPVLILSLVSFALAGIALAIPTTSMVTQSRPASWIQPTPASSLAVELLLLPVMAVCGCHQQFLQSRLPAVLQHDRPGLQVVSLQFTYSSVQLGSLVLAGLTAHHLPRLPLLGIDMSHRRIHF